MSNQTSEYQNTADVLDTFPLTENDNKMVVGNDGSPNCAAAGEEIKTSADTE